jgi:SAM-dependent methyltransferase
MRVAEYYSWLSWFQDVAHRVGHDTGWRTHSVHRRLASASGEVSAEVLHERLSDVLGDAGLVEPRVLDAGCGPGGSIFHLHAKFGGSYCGITLSGAQRDRASREAARRGLSGSCRFYVRDYDAALDDLLPDGADLIVAIESLAHSADPARSATHLARVLRPGGRLVIVDDMPAAGLALDDPEFADFRRGWLCPVVADAPTLAAALEAAGLTMRLDEDLTVAMPRRDAGALRRRQYAIRMALALLGATPARVLLGSLRGGLALEGLYRRQMMEYRMLVAARPHP